MGLERRINQELNLQQRTGRSHVQLNERPEKFLRELRSKVRQRVHTVPLVVEEERYFREGVSHKLGVSKYLVNELVRKGLLRYQRASFHEGYHREKLSALSLAYVTSWLFETPLERILYSSDNLRKEASLQNSIEERMKILFNAYRGCSWFEYFCLRQRREYPTPPALPVTPALRRQQLALLLAGCTHFQRGAIVRLTKAGFIIPYGQRPFQKKSSHNLISTEGVACLLSFVYGANSVSSLFAGREASAWSNLEQLFVQRRLLPYLVSHSILPSRKYLTRVAAQLAGVPSSRLRDAARLGVLRHSTLKHRNTYAKGIDIALYALKDTQRYNFTARDVAALFGMDSIDYRSFGMVATRDGKYSRLHYVFPLYDAVAEEVRKKVLRSFDGKEFSIPIYARGKRYDISLRAQIEYCLIYGLNSFDEDCLEHVRQQLESCRTRKRNNIPADDIVLLCSKRNILTGVRG